MTSAASNAYSVSVDIAEAPAIVFKLLTSPKTHSFWNQDVHVLDPPPDSLGLGSKWQESRSLLFMRQSCSVQVTELDESAMFATLRLDDSYNCILVKTWVSPHPANNGHSIVSQAVECFVRAGGTASPSERLACMWRKADRTLQLLRDYLQPCCPEAVQGRAVSGIPIPPVMMAV